MSRFANAMFVVLVFAPLAWVIPCFAGEQGQGKKNQDCGCGQTPGKETEGLAAGCTCVLVKTADFGSVCTYWTMFCPTSGSPSWGAFDSACGWVTRYSGCAGPCSGSTNPPSNCFQSVAVDMDASWNRHQVDPALDPPGPNAFPKAPDEWDPERKPMENEKLTASAECKTEVIGVPVFAMLRFNDKDSRRVKLWALMITHMKKVKIGNEERECPPAVLGLGRELASPNNPKRDVTISDTDIDFLPLSKTPGETQFVAVRFGDLCYRVLLSTRVAIPPK